MPAHGLGRVGKVGHLSCKQPEASEWNTPWWGEHVTRQAEPPLVASSALALAVALALVGGAARGSKRPATSAGGKSKGKTSQELW